MAFKIFSFYSFQALIMLFYTTLYFGNSFMGRFVFLLLFCWCSNWLNHCPRALVSVSWLLSFYAVVFLFLSATQLPVSCSTVSQCANRGFGHLSIATFLLAIALLLALLLDILSIYVLFNVCLCMFFPVFTCMFVYLFIPAASVDFFLQMALRQVFRFFCREWFTILFNCNEFWFNFMRLLYAA